MPWGTFSDLVAFDTRNTSLPCKDTPTQAVVGLQNQGDTHTHTHTHTHTCTHRSRTERSVLVFYTAMSGQDNAERCSPEVACSRANCTLTGLAELVRVSTTDCFKITVLLLLEALELIDKMLRYDPAARILPREALHQLYNMVYVCPRSVCTCRFQSGRWTC